MESNTRDKKPLILMGFLVFFSVIMVMTSIYYKRTMKGKLKNFYSIVITEQVKDSLPIDSIKVNLEKLKDIDSTGFSADVKIVDIIIKDYKRLSVENQKLKDSLK